MMSAVQATVQVQSRKRLKEILLLGISTFVFSVALTHAALAQPENDTVATQAPPQSFPQQTLDTEVRLQGADINNGDLGTNAGPQNAAVGAAEAKFKYDYMFTQNNSFFWEGRAVAAVGNAGYQDENTGAIANSGSFAEWRQSYFQFSDIGGVVPSNVRVGRQIIDEPYGVWWNQDFDAVKASYDSSLFRGSVSGGQNLFTYRTDSPASYIEDQKNISRVLAEGSYQYFYQNFVEARAAYADDRQSQSVGQAVNDIDPYNNPGNMYWGGVRAAGKTAIYQGADQTKLNYRVDLMGVAGHEDQSTLGATNITAVNDRNVQGWALDASTDIPIPNVKPLVHLGYAYGSGDDSATGTDHAFRQTGMQGNFSQIGALSQNTDNYGTVLRPELSNIHIISAGVTTPLLAASDAGVIYRYYRLADDASSIVSSGIVDSLNGTSKNLGQGVDFVFNTDVLKETTANIQHVQSLTFRSSLGFFRSGDAYGPASDQTAVRGLVELKVGF
jgi:hypothetical protein